MDFSAMISAHPVLAGWLRRLRRAAPWLVIDALLMGGAYALVYAVRVESVPPLLDARGYWFLAGSIVVMLCALYLMGVYDRLWARTSGHEVSVIVAAVMINTALVMPLDFLLAPRPLPLSVVLVGNLLALTGFVAVRYRSRLISGLDWRWRAVWWREFPVTAPRVLIIGAGNSGQATAWRLKHRAPADGLGYHVIGFVDDDPATHGLYIEGCRILGDRYAIPTLVEQRRIDLIVLAVHNISGHDFRSILALCEMTPARIKVVPDVFATLERQLSAPLLRDIRPEDLLGRSTVGWHEAVDTAPVTGKIVLVTGAAGSIGSELCRQMLAFAPQRLVLLDNNESGLHDLITELRTQPGGQHVTAVLADITNRPVVRRVFEAHRPQVVFHSAAYKHVPMLEDYAEEAVRVNVGGTLQVAGLARDFAAERFVLISTDKAVNPSSVMGASKRICELLVQAIAQQPGIDPTPAGTAPAPPRTRFTAVRFGNVLGSRGSVVPTFTRQIAGGGPVTVTHPEMSRYFMTIPEAVNLVIHAACLTEGGELFMLRMGEEVRIVELAERMIRLRGLRPYTDIPIEFVGTRPGEKLHEELHTLAEETHPTVHPGIVKLQHTNHDFAPVAFLDRVNMLFTIGLLDDPHPLDQLRGLIYFAQPEPEPVAARNGSGHTNRH